LGLFVRFQTIVRLAVILTILFASQSVWASAEVPDAEHHDDAAHGSHGPALGEILPLWSVIPFAGILLSIALFPLIKPHFWHHHYPKVSLFWALVFAVPFLIVFKVSAAHSIWHIMLLDFVPFIILLGGLFTVAGGIVVKGSFRGNPVVNLILILIGTLLASWIGTTGAAMVMIRPLLRANAWRKNYVHVVVFFIFLVANIGGSLTPLGDPPLFLGFLHGVGFFWTMFNISTQTLFVAVMVLAIFFVVDTYHYRKEDPPPDDGVKEPIKVEGLHNLLFLGGIIGAVLFSGLVHLGEVPVGLGIMQTGENLARDLFIIGMGAASWVTTKKVLREENEYSWGPILEVAYLFAGIFTTIIPALAILKAGEHGALAFLTNAVNTPGRYFWATGILSSFLDNAPTYLTFFNASMGQLYPGVAEPEAVQYLMGNVGTSGVVSGQNYLAAISAGAVFMGANTYIGNAPNFMVKAIAEEAGVPMPSFFGYMLKYSIPVLIGIFVLNTLIFI
jgi:Na+/H+ antiporter NhaD/arsenite permease-like protein